MDFNRLLENQKFKGTAVITAAVFFVLVMFFWDPEVLNYYPPCLFQTVTGYLCPGCGGLRGTHYLLHLDFYNAFAFNPLVYVSTILILYAIIYFISLLVFNKQLPKIPVNSKIITIVSILVLIFWIFRNL